MEPIVIEDVPSSMTDEGMNPPFGNSFSSMSPIIEDPKIPYETPTKMSIDIQDETTVETLAETRTKMKLTQYSKEPPYIERLTLQKVVKQHSFYLLGELKNIYVRIPLLQALHNIPIYSKSIRDLVVKKPRRKPKEPL